MFISNFYFQRFQTFYFPCNFLHRKKICELYLRINFFILFRFYILVSVCLSLFCWQFKQQLYWAKQIWWIASITMFCFCNLDIFSGCNNRFIMSSTIFLFLAYELCIFNISCHLNYTNFISIIKQKLGVAWCFANWWLLKINKHTIYGGCNRLHGGTATILDHCSNFTLFL